jgi:hypothetical protein
MMIHIKEGDWSFTSAKKNINATVLFLTPIVQNHLQQMPPWPEVMQNKTQALFHLKIKISDSQASTFMTIWIIGFSSIPCKKRIICH